MTPLHRRLAIITAQKSLKEEDVILSHGGRAPYYYDMKPTLMDGEGADIIAKLVLNHIHTMEHKPDYVAGLEVEGPMMGPMISAEAFRRKHEQRSFFVRKQAKDHGNPSIFGGLQHDSDIQGKTVLILADVATTGSSIYKAAKPILKAGGLVSSALTVIDRQQGATSILRSHGIEMASFLTDKEVQHISGRFMPTPTEHSPE